MDAAANADHRRDGGPAGLTSEHVAKLNETSVVYKRARKDDGGGKKRKGVRGGRTPSRPEEAHEQFGRTKGLGHL